MNPLKPTPSSPVSNSPLILHSQTPSTPDEKPLTDMKLNHKYTVLMRIGKRSFIVFAVY